MIYLSKKNRDLYLPYKLILIYISLTLFISFFGPIKYVSFDKSSMLFFLIALFFSLTLATLLAIKLKVKTIKKNIQETAVIKMVKLSVLIVFPIKVSLLLSSIAVFGLPDFNGFYDSIANTYSDKSIGEYSDENVFRQIDTLFTLGYYVSVIGSFYYFNKLPFFFRLLSLISIFLNLIYVTFFLGDQKPFLDLIIFLACILAIKRAQKEKRILTPSRFIIFSVLISILILFFSSIIHSRRELFNKSTSIWVNAHSYIDINHPWLYLLPEDLKYQISFFFIYPTMGWYGLALSLKLDFEWTYFVGGFRGLNNIFSQFFGIENLYYKTYLGRMYNSFGYDGLSNWNTIFPWLASDFTFVGSIFFVALFMFIFMRSWILSIKYKNPLAIFAFCNIAIMFVYITANNQLFAQRGSAITTIMLLILWIILRNKFNYVEEIEEKI